MDVPTDLIYMIHHVFLPPKLPQEDDSSLELDLMLLRESEEALNAYHSSSSTEPRDWRWTACTKMVRNMIEARHRSGNISPRYIKTSLQAMSNKDTLAFHIRAQNAGLLVRRCPDRFIFESFELSPTNSSVMTTKGRLRRFFPGPAIAVGQDIVLDISFQTALADFLVKLDTETISDTYSDAKKGGIEVEEVRDSIHPKYITEMLTAMLRGIGEPANITRIQKCTRDDVLWDRALKPWRRSPLWLLVRVGLQTILIGEGENQHQRYKSFMIYFMSRTLKQALNKLFPSEILFIMVKKISRRLLKVGPCDPLLNMQCVQKIINDTHRMLDDRWRLLEKIEDSSGHFQRWESSDLSFATDSRLTALNLQSYLKARNSCSVRAVTKFREQHPQRFKIDQMDILFLNGLNSSETRLALKDVELWVRDDLDNWLFTQQRSRNSCAELANLIQRYITVATPVYTNNAENTSLMFLTVMELWVALDRCAIYHHSILADYDSGFSPLLFRPLLLPTNEQMQRLGRIETYIEARTRESQYNFSHIFVNVNSANSLNVRYFENSQAHRELKRQIEANATNERERKRDELARSQKQYHRLIQQASSKMHVEVTRYNKDSAYQEHDRMACEKCLLEIEASKIQIDLHEWPLPSQDLEAKSAVFELDVPPSLNEWRNITYQLLTEVFSPEFSSDELGPHNSYSLQNYVGLKSYMKTKKGKIQFASKEKSFLVSHYRSMKISSATESSICVKNGLRYAMEDVSKSRWAKELLERCDIREKCTFQLPSGPYKTLQYALTDTEHTSNEVLSRQNECPLQLNLDEFYAFATLRSGYRLQWRNIAREVLARTLNFSHEAAYLLLAQTAWQAGPTGATYCRDSHIDLEEEEFGTALLSVLEEALGTIEGNWQGATALRTFVLLASRLLSISPHSRVHKLCYGYLRRARTVGLNWVREVNNLFHEERNASQLNILTLRALEMALTCHCTFDVDEEHISELLRSNDDVATITQCNIIIHDRCPKEISLLPPLIEMLYHRYERLSHFLEPRLRHLLLQDQTGVDAAIHSIWEGYLPGNTWTSLREPNERWLTTMTSDRNGYTSMAVHYNILNGSLIVDGAPLTRLPESYELHETYQRLFQEKVLEVVPSSMKGMIFETRNDICGQQVHFKMQGSDLIIRTRDQDQTCELIPHYVLRGDFPTTLETDYVHWLDIRTNIIEWRPLNPANSVWVTSNQNWHMKSIREKGPTVLTLGTKTFIDVRSSTAIMICNLLGPLEQSKHIHIIHDSTTDELDINLPRMKLDFRVQQSAKRLESKQFRGMVVDNKQSFGTFTGLRNKLVLRDAEGPARCVIIPYGEVDFMHQGHHVCVSIKLELAPHVKCHTFQVDSQLGRLVDNGSLQSRLYRAYLHATTSHCLPDQLTGRTGTEEALSILSGAGTYSSLKLEAADDELLRNIARLTPHRQFYPEHLEVTQQIRWRPLLVLSQHCAFYERVSLIFDHAISFQVFDQEPMSINPLEEFGNQKLLNRAALRDAPFQMHGYGAEMFRTTDDKIYNARDQDFDGVHEVQVCRISQLVKEWSTSLTVCKELLTTMELWRDRILGPGVGEAPVIGFDVTWLSEPSEIFPRYWSEIQAFLSGSDIASDKYKVMIFLSTLSYSGKVDQDLVQTLLAFATHPVLRTIRPPPDTLFLLGDGYKADKDRLLSMVQNKVKHISSCPESSLPTLPKETRGQAKQRRRYLFEKAKAEQCKLFVKGVMAQWPGESVSATSLMNTSAYIMVPEAANDASQLFQRWNQNIRFRAYINKVQGLLNGLHSDGKPLRQYIIPLPTEEYITKKTTITFADLATAPAPQIARLDSEDLQKAFVQTRTPVEDHDSLRILLDDVSKRASSVHEQQYAEALQRSFVALQEEFSTGMAPPSGLTTHLRKHLEQARNQVEEIYGLLCKHLQSRQEDFALNSWMLPRLTPTSILSNLAIDNICKLSPRWKEAIVHYGLAITALQRAERLLAAEGNSLELRSELENPGHEGWNPLEYPEWLLFEIENGILIREEQIHIAHEMMQPSSDVNSIVQLNMGQGKSSVIVPIVATALANKKQLARVVVLKPLAMQMLQLLASKLGGMLNRRVFYMPISRSLSLSQTQAKQVIALYKDCMQSGGVLLVQPEHLLSFELMGLERLHAGDSHVGKIMVGGQDWLHINSRDILDESDEILSERYELIYTIGTQRSIEFSPERWSILQHLLGWIAVAAEQIHRQYPDALEVVCSTPGAFPRLRIFQSEALDELVKAIARRICDSDLPSFPLWNLSTSKRAELFKYLTDPNLDSMVDATYFDSESMKCTLLLLKGLLANGVIPFTLQKRWRVNYGLDPTRTQLAVPYHAKDCPAPRAEFSHPDATIALTCLAYYYTGLTNEQLFASFEKLMHSDRAQEEFDRWIKDAPEMPKKFRHLNGVNLSNPGQCLREVFPPLKFAKAVIDFFTSTLVFPSQMKEFPHKLSSSGWYIAREKSHVTTGFSGTNDSRYVLPLSITQLDLPRQRSTNAAVLDCLLRPENSFADVTQYSDSGSLNAHVLLEIVPKLHPQVRVILDVGAQVLELQNSEVASQWLSRVPVGQAQAAIFVDAKNNICVVDRDRTVEPLQISPFAKQMDQCLVYLDESHTRGTDLKLPNDYRAIVTLGPGLTKDRLVQACGRMRKLGKGQSVVFCCSTDIQHQILEVVEKTTVAIEVADVLAWSIAGTCLNTKKSIPLWATQGARHQQRRAVLSNSSVDSGVVGALLEPEGQSLEYRYGQHITTQEGDIFREVNRQHFVGREEQMAEIRSKCNEFGITSFASAALQEEQERELSPEIEREREVERPSQMAPYNHEMHGEVRALVTQGILKLSDGAFRPAFEIFRKTTARGFLELTAWPFDLLVTIDFMKTVKEEIFYVSDLYLRPVHWILSIKTDPTRLIIISPYEANLLLPDIRRHKLVTLHVYSPRLSTSIRTLEDLSFCTVPPVAATWSIPPLVTQLNLFAGQLYLKSYHEYEAVCGLLGLCTGQLDEGIQAGSDGFIRPASRRQEGCALQATCRFTRSPVAFVRALVAMRRKGQGFALSHVGRILNAGRLTEDDFKDV